MKPAKHLFTSAAGKLKKHAIKTFFSATLLFLAFAGPDICAVTLVGNNKANAVIVIPDKPIRPVKFAAEELQYHIRRATGIELPVVKKSDFREGNIPVFIGWDSIPQKYGVGKIKLPPNGYLIKVTDKALFFAGDDKPGDPLRVPYNTYARTGTAFAVYDFLENRMNVRWLWPGELGTDIPETKTLEIKEYSKQGKPRFAQKRLCGKGSFLLGQAGWKSSKAHDDYFIEESRWMRRHRFAQDYMPDGMTHPFTDYWDRFGKTHPKLFQQMPDGRRGKDPTQKQQYSHAIGMCLSCGLVQHRVDEWSKRPKRSPYLGAGQQDANTKCTCPACLAMDVPDPNLGIPFEDRFKIAREVYLAQLNHKKLDLNLKLAPDFLEKLQKDSRWFGWPLCLGSLSDRYAKFWLNVQKLAQKIDPDVYIWGIAYANTVNPPRKTKLNDHVIVSIVPPYYSPFTEKRMAGLRKSIQGWSDSGARIFLRPNYLLSGHNLPLFVARKMGEDIAFTAKHGMFGAQYDSITGQWASQGPNFYVIARMLEHPEMSPDEVLNEYYNAFGPAAAAVKDYFSHWEKVENDLADTKKLPKTVQIWETFFMEADIVFTPEIMAKGRRLLEIAGARAKNDATAAARVEFLEKGLRHAELTLEVIRSRREGVGSKSYEKAIKALDAYRAGIEKDYVANMTILHFNETGRGRYWPR
jgi:hypothetical protein